MHFFNRTKCVIFVGMPNKFTRVDRTGDVEWLSRSRVGSQDGTRTTHTCHNHVERPKLVFLGWCLFRCLLSLGVPFYDYCMRIPLAFVQCALLSTICLNHLRSMAPIFGSKLVGENTSLLPRSGFIAWTLAKLIYDKYCRPNGNITGEHLYCGTVVRYVFWLFSGGAPPSQPRAGWGGSKASQPPSRG